MTAAVETRWYFSFWLLRHPLKSLFFFFVVATVGELAALMALTISCCFYKAGGSCLWVCRVLHAGWV